MTQQILLRLTEDQMVVIVADVLRGTTQGRHRRVKRTLASDAEAIEAKRLAGQIVAHMVKCGVVFMRGEPFCDGAAVMRGLAS